MRVVTAHQIHHLADPERGGHVGILKHHPDPVTQQNRLADINPADIDHIEIIRGAAAAALYGSRANNGVVQIFTRRGTIGKPHFTYTSRFSQSQLREQQPFNAER